MIEVQVPSPGESITEVLLSNWLVSDGELVEKDQEIAEVDSEKATLTVVAPASGRIQIKISAGTTVKVGETVCLIDETEAHSKPEKNDSVSNTNVGKKDNERKTIITPLARKVLEEKNISPERFTGEQRITRKMIETNFGKDDTVNKKTDEHSIRKPMTPLRLKLSQRLVSVKNETAMLTTFNEVDMSRVIALREQFKQEKRSTVPGFVSFFIRAATLALKEFPEVNAMIDENDIVYYNVVHISVAVSTDKGLMAPVLRNTEKLNLFETEDALKKIAEKARSNKITLDDLNGGTFTITNGGVFGSLLSTPIINPPQSAILGMHKIMDRAVVVDGQIVIRPMMYVALSYDHRIIDGKESVGFLVRIKELIEKADVLI